MSAIMRAQRFDTPGLQLAYDSAYDAVAAAVDRRDRLDAAIAAMAENSDYTPVVTRLGCLRGVGVLTAFGLAVEIGDWQRLTGRSIGAYLGLVPTEHSSGASRSQGPITETGNGYARWLLIEAVGAARGRAASGVRDVSPIQVGALAPLCCAPRGPYGATWTRAVGLKQRLAPARYLA